MGEPFGSLRTAFEAILGGGAILRILAAGAIHGISSIEPNLAQNVPPGPKFENFAQTSLFA